MKLFKHSLFFLLGLTLFMASCSKTEVDVTNPNDPGFEPPVTDVNPILNNLSVNGEGLDLDCITILYAFEMQMESGAIVTIASDEDAEVLFEGQDGDYPVDFVYPLSVEDSDDQTVLVDDLEGLGELFASCFPEDGWGDIEGDGIPAFLINTDEFCYDLVYPITLVDLEGVESVANSETELVSLMAENELLFFVFPFDLINEDNEIVTVEDAEGLFAAIFDCEEISNPCDSTVTYNAIGCYDIVFPINLEMLDGSIETANDENEFVALLWEGNVAGFAYPINLTDVDGNAVIAASEEELIELLEECGGIFTNDDAIFLFSIATDPENDCFELVYPISVENEDGSIEVINNESEFEAYIMTGASQTATLTYPISVTLNEDGSTVVINEFFGLITVLEDCE